MESRCILDSSYFSSIWEADEIRNSDTGGATLKTPEKGWDNDELSSIFAQTVPPLATAASSGVQPDPTNDQAISDPSTTDSAAGNSSSSSGLSGGAIAGIVIGVLAGACTAAGFIFFRIRRLKKIQASNDGEGNLPPVGDGERWGKPELASDSRAQLHEAPDTSGIMGERNGRQLDPRAELGSNDAELNASGTGTLLELPVGKDGASTPEMDSKTR